MNLGNVLSIGANGLNAASQGTQVASQNISNASTPGYTRRVANLEAVPLDQGGGVRAIASTRVNDQFLEKRGLAARSYSGESDARVKTLAVMDTVFADGQGTIGDALNAFDASLTDLTVSPGSSAVRQVVLSRADDLTQAFHRSAEALAGARADANGRVVNEVAQVNQQLDQIGSLNAQIVAGKSVRQDVGDLEDKRDNLIRSVSSSLPVNVIPDDTGAVTLMLAGARTLVSVDAKVHHLIASPDATSGAVRIQRQTAGQVEDITSFFTSGSIGGTISARDGALADAQTALDQLATDLTTGYNTQHALGVGLDGTTGRSLFTAPATVNGAADNFGVSADVQGHPENLGAAQAPTSLPSDNRNALALLGVRDQNVANAGTMTIQQSYSAVLAAGGAAARSAIDQSAYASASLSQIDALREAASGVSTDEEMLSLMKFQRAYQASLRVIETADSMLSELLNMRIGS